MISTTFNDKENKILSFIDQVNDRQRKAELDNKWHSDPIYKKRMLDRCKDKAKDCCFNRIIGDVYVNALPLSPSYKSAYGDELRDDMTQYIVRRCPNGVSFYMKEAIKKKSPIADKINKHVNTMVKDYYSEMDRNPTDYSDEDMVFKMDDEQQEKINSISRDLELDDISKLISDNVKSSAIAEIIRAKKEKQAIKDIEDELANDPSITTDNAIESALSLRGFEKKIYEPTLFEAMMIGNMKKVNDGKIEPACTYGAMEEFGVYENADAPVYASNSEMAFIESVKDFTKLSIVRALKLESITPRDITKMTYKYMKG